MTSPAQEIRLAQVPPLYLCLADAVKYSGISKSGLYLLLGQGRLRAKKHGTRLLVELEALRQFLVSLPDANFRPPRGS